MMTSGVDYLWRHWHSLSALILLTSCLVFGCISQVRIQFTYVKCTISRDVVVWHLSSQHLCEAEAGRSPKSKETLFRGEKKCTHTYIIAFFICIRISTELYIHHNQFQNIPPPVPRYRNWSAFSSYGFWTGCFI